MKKSALITGVTGQDGSYLSEFLLKKGYIVHGIKRRSSSLNTERIDHIFEEIQSKNNRFILHYGDLTDSASLYRLINEIKPDEIYNLAAQSQVAVSFEVPLYTAEVNGMGALHLLEAIRISGLIGKTKYYQASTSELFGNTEGLKQSEKSKFQPQSPYAYSKLMAYWATVNYREAYGLFGCNGILFNHESPRRGETFVTRKITMGLVNIVLGNRECLYIGNLNALRDWGHAKDYVEMQWLMLQQNKPEDYVIASGQQHSVRDFVTWACEHLGMQLEFRGDTETEVGVIISMSKMWKNGPKVGDVILRVDPRYYRPTEVHSLLGDFTKAANEFGWKPKTDAKALCEEMVDADLQILGAR